MWLGIQYLTAAAGAAARKTHDATVKLAFLVDSDSWHDHQLECPPPETLFLVSYILGVM